MLAPEIGDNTLSKEGVATDLGGEGLGQAKDLHRNRIRDAIMSHR